MSATAGKVALVSSTVALSGGCPVGGAIIDFVGYGTGTSGASCFEGTAAAPTLTNTTADFRRNNGLQDTDSNTADFITGAPNRATRRLAHQSQRRWRGKSRFRDSRRHNVAHRAGDAWRQSDEHRHRRLR